MKTKIWKIFIALTFIAILIANVVFVTAAEYLTNVAKDTVQSFGIQLVHGSKSLYDGSNINFGYKVDYRNVYRIYYGNSSSKKFDTTVICLNRDGRFPQEEQTTGNYKSLGEATKNTLHEAKESITEDKANKILWLMRNAVLPEDSEDLKNIKLSKIYESLIESTESTVNPVTLTELKRYLTEDDLVFAYQYAVWSVTNDLAQGTPIFGTTDGTNWDSISGNDRWGYKGQKAVCINRMIEYYLENYTGNDIIPTPSSTSVNPKITTPEDNIEYDMTGSKIFVGPFKIEPSTQGGTTMDYSVDFTFKNESGNIVSNPSYLITSTNTSTTSILPQTKEALEGHEFYIALPLNTTVRKIGINLSTASIRSTTSGYVWTATSGSNMQPLLSILRSEEGTPNVNKEHPFRIHPPERQNDVALRKYVAAVIRNNRYGEPTIVYNGEDNGRKPIARTSTIEGWDYEYAHRKDPVDVKIGDRVVYAFQLYNEGETTLRINQVTDYLPPSGLRFVEANNTKYTSAQNSKCMTANNGRKIIYSDSINGYIVELEPHQSMGTPIYIEFEVTGEAEGKTITNIAEITAISDENGVPLTNDKDSAPNKILPEAEADWEDYTGNNNKQDLSDENYFYKGDEDDDDFDKLIVAGKVDLALRKSVVSVNGQAKDRQREPDTTPLYDNSEATTTSNFTDVKTPVSVKPGDIVVYTIRVFNEGNADGYACKIEDYIPEGLGFIVNHNINYDNQWELPTGATQVRLSSIPNATNNLSVSDFSRSGAASTQEEVGNIDVIVGNAAFTTAKLANTKLSKFNTTTKKLDIKTVQVACVVLDGADESTLRNLAAITEYKNEAGEVIEQDIDSRSDNDYKADFNEGQHEDDEDFEKLKLTQVPYDLALKKFVTSVSDSNGNEKTIAEGQRRNLQVTNVDTLVSRETVTDRADATYSFGVDKNAVPVTVSTGDHVVYTIRLYNEGLVDGVVEELIDTVPEGLEFLPNSDINRNYGWQTFNDQNNSGWKTGIKTAYLNGKVIPAFNKTKVDQTQHDPTTGTGIDKGISYVEVKVEFKMTSNVQEKIKNIAEITRDDGDDNDSTPNNKIENEDDEDFDVIIPPAYDLALKKYVSSLTDATNTSKTIPDSEKRQLQVTDVTALVNRGDNQRADATYGFGLDKDSVPVTVVKGDNVVYTIRVYNEGLTDGKVLELIDTVPEGLEFLPNSAINTTYGWQTFNDQSNSGWKEGIKTDYLKNTTIPAFDKTKTNQSQYDQASGTGIDKGVSYAEVKVEFKMTSNSQTKIKNIAEITEDDGPDNDSTPNNKIPTEDDEDFDVIIPSIYDLALKKYVSSLTDATNKSKKISDEEKRELHITDVTALKNRSNSNGKADAQYTFGVDKEPTPVHVAEGDNVVYTIRVYNEGLTDGKVLELVDNVPEGLVFLKDSTINKKYGWSEFNNSDSTGNKWKSGIKTTYLEGTVISAFDSSKENQSNYNENTGTGIDHGVSFAEVKIEFKVNTSDAKLLKNIAEITKDDGEDNDSEPDNQDPSEDDEDFDVIIPTKYDLALRKFITQIDNKEVKDRIPEVNASNLKDGSKTTAEYKHTKEPKIVVKGQVVTYTIRVYNEGTVDGQAIEIKDNLPEGITYLPKHETNIEYKWKMYDKNGEETTDVSKATTIKTEYGKGKIISKFDKEKMNEPAYIDVKVAFEVTQDSVTAGDKVIVNTAEITDDNGDDIDSTPNNNKDGEDDIDKEYLRLKYFDLSLLKYVSKVIIVEDGVTKEIETKYDGTENPEPVVKVELKKKKLKTTQVKYVYSIKITNEGEIEGYATEITDRIPDGLAFYEEDNTEYGWKVSSEGIITTDYLKDTLLKPGESAFVPVVLRWVNSENNLGQKINVAEISKDKNEYGIPDIDSTPNNNKEGEDDQDNAIVVLSIQTGSTPLYITLGISILSIIGVGSYMIYKRVLKR